VPFALVSRPGTRQAGGVFEAPLDRARLQVDLRTLAARGVWLGTSSWKYPGWCGQLYEAERYAFRGRFSQTRFERECLTEYAGVFPTVCVDAAYYTFPKVAQLAGLAAQVPVGFRFGFKVTDAITLRRFPNLPRFGALAGQVNPDYLSVARFQDEFLTPLQTIRPHVGPLIFEFSRFYPADYAHGRDFVADLDRFLGGLPRDWRYAVEIRNATFLHPVYFECLARHGVAHAYNAWTAMPPVGQQLDLPGSRTAAFAVARFLLREGRDYAAAVQRFSPYRELGEVNAEARAAGARLITAGRPAGTESSTFVYVNNRLEGNALLTLQAMIELAREQGGLAGSAAAGGGSG
jgi:uncharacterized protein YecE (DUF72 family)